MFDPKSRVRPREAALRPLHHCCPTPPIMPSACSSGPVVKTKFVEAVHRLCPGSGPGPGICRGPGAGQSQLTVVLRCRPRRECEPVRGVVGHGLLTREGVVTERSWGEHDEEEAGVWGVVMIGERYTQKNVIDHPTGGGGFGAQSPLLGSMCNVT